MLITKTKYHKWLQICFNYLYFSLFHNGFNNLYTHVTEPENLIRGTKWME